MKFKISFILFFLITNISLLWAADLTIKKQPSEPPSLFTTYLKDQVKIDATYIRFSNDFIDLNGFGIKYKEAGPHSDSLFAHGQWYIGCSGIFGKGETFGTDISISGGGVILGTNHGLTFFRSDSGSNLAIDFGLYTGLSFMRMNVSSSAIDYSENMPSFFVGLTLGLQYKLMFTKSFGLVPYYVLDMRIASMKDLNATSSEDEVVGVGTISHLLGFDIILSTISIGAIFDMFGQNTGDEKSIIVSVSYRWDD